jgi:membrane protein implicated in regulation of membrane protease activity
MISLQQLTLHQQIFFWLACIGGTIFIIRTIAYFFGHASDIDIISYDSLSTFDFISIYNISAFSLMAGLTGFFGLSTSLSPWLVDILAFLTGLSTVILLIIIGKAMNRLQSDGTLDLHNAIGQTATVYLTIKAHGSGQIQLVLQGQLMTLSACSEENDDISTGQAVVVQSVQGQLLLVKPITSKK